MRKSVSVPEETVMNRIYLVRKQKVMLDRDLADLYGVETKRLKEAVKRNLSRFPSDFMFVMNETEFKNWRSQFAASNLNDRMGLRHKPFCFTEQGVTMLACVLSSPRAIEMNIHIIRVFTKLRETLLTNKDILLKLEKMEKQVSKNTDDVSKVFSVLRKLLQEQEVPRKRIGYRTASSAS